MTGDRPDHVGVKTLRVAAIDCGTNSIRLLIADIENGNLVDVVRTMVIVRLGEGVDKSGEFSQAALARTFAAIDTYAELIAKHKPVLVRFVATSASRDVSNRDEFVSGIVSRLGIEPDIISGDEEAELSFLGATADLLNISPTPEAPYLVIDIGGGSTEFVLGTTKPTAAVSTNVGCVRMTERHLVSDPPTNAQIAAATADIDAAIDQAYLSVPISEAKSLIGLAGSVTTVAALALGLSQYDSAAIHGSRISADEVHRVTNELLTMTRAQRATLGPMHEGRIDVIGSGALVLDRIMARTGLSEVIVSERDILDGIARALVSSPS
jgi:exopolyphosphatase/guanosine-5'-triphosphate,3'-diphosphate pyrophosphatase